MWILVKPACQDVKFSIRVWSVFTNFADVTEPASHDKYGPARNRKKKYYKCLDRPQLPTKYTLTYKLFKKNLTILQTTVSIDSQPENLRFFFVSFVSDFFSSAIFGWLSILRRKGEYISVRLGVWSVK